MPAGRTLIALAMAATLAGCSAASTSTPAASTPSPTASDRTPASVAPSTSTPRPTPHAHHGAATRRVASPAGPLAISTASASQVQPQPSPGACHAAGSGLDSLPDRRCTPGALNPAVTQATIDQTICVSGYTRTIRPAPSITEAEKAASMAAYGDSGSMAGFEYDHLVSLELGGAANDPRNLWPEPGASPNPKDTVEDALHRLVCAGQMSLAQAQHIIASDWVSYARGHTGASAVPSASAPPASTPSAPAPVASVLASGPPLSGRVHCRDFATHAAAQSWFVAHGGSASHDVSGLDANHNGLACEDLP